MVAIGDNLKVFGIHYMYLCLKSMLDNIYFPKAYFTEYNYLHS